MTRDGQPRRLIVGISGASGVIMAARLLRALRERPEIETQLVATDGAWENFRAETSHTRAEVEALADVCYDSHDLAAPIADPPVAADQLRRDLAMIFDADVIGPEPAAERRMRLFGQVADRHAHGDRPGGRRKGKEGVDHFRARFT